MHIRPRWRLLFVPARDGAENMARDVALQEHSRETGECVLSIYTWSRPTLSFGRNQTAKGLYDMQRISAEQIDVVRRPTGGRAILHNREITYSVTGPDTFAPTLTKAYDQINAVLLKGLTSLGAAAEIAKPEGAAPRPDQSPCFAEPVKGELIALGRKLVGSAQHRENGAFLQHGSILVANDQGHLTELTLNGRTEGAEPSASTLSELLPEPPTPEKLADAMFNAVKELEDSDAKPMDEAQIRMAALGFRPHFIDPLWTWRR